MQLSITEAKGQLTALVRRAEAGDEVVLTRHGQATVKPVPVRRRPDADARWGKGLHPAGPNFGDCFAYDVAGTRDCPLLHVGAGFARTDVESVL